MNVIAVDFDKTICNTFNEPIPHMVRYVNNLYENPENFIVVYTARSYKIFEDTRLWLLKNEVKFHSLTMEKIRATIYIDDKSIRPGELK